jgi:hypothetical protein
MTADKFSEAEVSESMWQRSDDWVGTEIEDSYVMVNVETGKYVSLNQTAMAIWDAVESPRSEAEIAQRLCDAFDVGEETSAAAVSRTLAKMHELSIVAPAGDR